MSESEPRQFSKVLIANRGEIAVRVIRALREIGVTSAVIHSDVDRKSLPVLLADEAYLIGPAPSLESYLRTQAIVELAIEIGADAIHPGYGFLAENADFARLCEDAGVKFIGPSASAITSMGSKIESRMIIQRAGVPVVPGGVEILATADDAKSFADEIGYPVMLKASAGGGGKGMRLVRDPGDLSEAFRAASSEAQASFANDAVYIEKFIEQPRHVEVQIIADEHGDTVALGERECSLQRRHQKVLEESPSPAVTPELRRQMCDAAVQAARAVDYTNAGTVEFLLDQEGRFYFLEMNTRIQVEHPVTEMITGLDLVRAQIDVARGARLSSEFHNVQPSGHSIEMRIYAEDPYHGFAPSPGTIERLRWPEGPGVRNDAGVYEGSEVSIYYDPMLAKLVVWGRDRMQAMERMSRALDELRIEGIRTTVPLFKALVEDPDFCAGNLDIGMLDRKLSEGKLLPKHPIEFDDLAVIAAALEHLDVQSRASAAPVERGGRRERWRRAARIEGLRGDRWN